MPYIEIEGTDYAYDESSHNDLSVLSGRVQELRADGELSQEVLRGIRQYFRIKNIYHSNAIEGNVLAVGETRQVVEHGLTIAGRPLKDQAEARNLSSALDFLEELAGNRNTPITEHDVRQLHALVLKGINEEAEAYRSVPVIISGSEFSPPGPESIRGEMEIFGRWLSTNSTPSTDVFASVQGLAAAAAAHTWFVTVHPFIDGNGRVARLLLNLMLMRHGYPIAIITKDDRFRYYDALEDSQATDLTPFIMLVAECIQESLEEYEAAAKEEREKIEWAASLAQKFTEPERVRAENEYEVWKNAMDLLKSHVQQIVNIFDQQVGGQMNVYLKDFGNLDFEKYYALRQHESAKRTWFLRVDFRRNDKTARYLFFFGHASYAMGNRCDVTLHIAREEPSNSYNYERLDGIQHSNVPDLTEIGYEMRRERYVIKMRNRRTRASSIEEFTKRFFEDIVGKHFSV
ncbi:Fic family protein [Candidatus Poribacteria bacterium]|nr:Fic family protein [Gammaproteobacteria bacterium]MYF98020.1 Fic family protein [Candidatus Poribacteria bacterium]